MPKNEDYAVGNKEAGKNPASGIVDELRRSFRAPGAGSPNTPAEKIEDALSQVQNQIRERQMCTEQELQACLAKASAHVADSQAVDNMFAMARQIASVVSQGNEIIRSNAQQLSDLITQLGGSLSRQQSKADRQMAMSLQQAVSALSDAQSSMFQSMAVSEMTLLVKSAEQVAKDLLAPGEVQ